MVQLTGVGSPVSEILSRNEQSFVDEWIQNIRANTRSSASISEADLKKQRRHRFRRISRRFPTAMQSYQMGDPRWKQLRDLLQGDFHSWALQGFTPTETATFVSVQGAVVSGDSREEIRDARSLADQQRGMHETPTPSALHDRSFPADARGPDSPCAGRHVGAFDFNGKARTAFSRCRLSGRSIALARRW